MYLQKLSIGIGLFFFQAAWQFQGEFRFRKRNKGENTQAGETVILT